MTVDKDNSSSDSEEYKEGNPTENDEVQQCEEGNVMRRSYGAVYERKEDFADSFVMASVPEELVVDTPEPIQVVLI